MGCDQGGVHQRMHASIFPDVSYLEGAIAVAPMNDSGARCHTPAVLLFDKVLEAGEGICACGARGGRITGQQAKNKLQQDLDGPRTSELERHWLCAHSQISR